MQAGFLSYSVPLVAPPGKFISATFQLQNLGARTWKKSEVKLFGFLPNNEAHFDLPADVGPGETVSFQGAFTTPGAPGRYRYEFRMVLGGGTPFGEALEHEIKVTAGAVPDMRHFPLPLPVLAPSDLEIQHPQATNAFAWVQGYRRALDGEVSRQFARTARKVRNACPSQLVTVRQGIEGIDAGLLGLPVDAATTGPFLDFLSPESYFFDPETIGDLTEDQIKQTGVAVQAAYARWASDGRPVCWIEFGRSLLQFQGNRKAQQARFLEVMVEAILASGAEGILAWWYPGGNTMGNPVTDFGIVDPDPQRSPRPAAIKLKEKSAESTAPRPQRPSRERSFDPKKQARAFADLYNNEDVRTIARDALSNGRTLKFRHLGEGTTSDSSIVRIGATGSFTRDLWAMLDIELRVDLAGEEWFEVGDGGLYPVPLGTSILVRAQITNLGVATWKAGSVRLGANENLGANVNWRWEIPRDLPRRGQLAMPPRQLISGLTRDTTFQLQMVAENRTWIDGAVRLRLVVPEEQGEE